MTQKAIEALAADREALLKIGAGLGEAEWGSESGCPGWSVQSVVAHLGALYWAVVDPSTLPEVAGAADRAGPGGLRRAAAVLVVGPGTGRLRVGQPPGPRRPGRPG